MSGVLTCWRCGFETASEQIYWMHAAECVQKKERVRHVASMGQLFAEELSTYWEKLEASNYRYMELNAQYMNLEKLTNHITKRLSEEYNIVITPEWQGRVLKGECDVPLPEPIPEPK
jgi:predicted transcriptional regulator